ncbi:hypothetical protein, partial [Azospirillum sp. TSO22-1]|uniref:hypothetical protein n=1 Tax=Azospirillum sp. TSO22-1 TaxID=716789 RepID=UPI001B3BC573
VGGSPRRKPKGGAKVSPGRDALNFGQILLDLSSPSLQFPDEKACGCCVNAHIPLYRRFGPM